MGFGAQSLVKDVISGFFIIFEGQMEVGDYVQINGDVTGTVEEIGLRVTKIREFNQRLHYFSNGEISRVTNYNRDQMRPLVAVTVPFETDQELVQKTLNQVNEDLGRRLAPFVIEPFSIYGITNIGKDGVEYTITAVVTPEEYWSTEREMPEIDHPGLQPEGNRDRLPAPDYESVPGDPDDFPRQRESGNVKAEGVPPAGLSSSGGASDDRCDHSGHPTEIPTHKATRFKSLPMVSTWFT